MIHKISLSLKAKVYVLKWKTITDQSIGIGSTALALAQVEMSCLLVRNALDLSEIEFSVI